ncbi:aminotransferase class I/II-fold pyridoxal phosphate-dependent enzyme [Streptomyces sp. NPDC058595]|uniref:aminotransferase class I/II-fold pyridoxal phosphate-dependent enzyme n=1 Tax=Streptomyces sp. NPDC058595 TaxID=3346550 RepID=UPI003661EDEC
MTAPVPALRDIAGPPGEPTPYKDIPLLADHEEQGHDPAVRLNLGEAHQAPHPALVAAMNSVPAHAHGYLMTPYGWPALREVLRTYITATHRLSGVAEMGVDFDVASCAGHTRSVMPDFGRLLIEEHERARSGSPLRGLRARVRSRRAIAVTSDFAWDYAGALAPVGFEMRTFRVCREGLYQPDVTEVTEVLARARRETAGPVMIVINAQHNPSGAQWTPSVVRGMIRAALAADATVLIDDAYYGVVDPGVTPTSALRILLQELRGLAPASRPRWLAVRSLGKQFACNGWGVGSQTSSPDTLRELGERLTRRTYPGGPLEMAMAAWLGNPDSDRFLDHSNERLATRRAEAGRLLADELGYPSDAYYVGECATYMLIRVPPWVVAEGRDYRRLVLARAGVLLGEAHMSSPGRPPRSQGGHARLYVGAPEEVVTGALKSMARAGMGWGKPSWR